jgi:AGCS family alanine or glycine:cation symporter
MIAHLIHEFQQAVHTVKDIIWSLPFIIFFVAVACIITVALHFIQFRTFIKSCKLVFFPEKSTSTKAGDMSPFQAFLNTLSVSIGNGCLSGTAVALFAGGPGVAFWMFVVGLLCMAIRFAEVFLAVSFAIENKDKSKLGGPFLYIEKLPGGMALTYFYGVACLFFSLTAGNAMQCNTISTAFNKMIPSDWNVFSDVSIVKVSLAVILTSFALYVLLGGTQRIVKVIEKVVPLKVGLFFLTILVVLGYYWTEIPAAVALIMDNAFTPKAMAGSAVGLTLQQVFYHAAYATVNASEAGLGTASILYGSTGSKEPINDASSSMLSTFISNNIAMTMVTVALVASGAWMSGETGAPMVIEAYQSVFGYYGGWILTFLTLPFGLGVIVPYCYIARQSWIYVTGGRALMFFPVVFIAASFLGAIADIGELWTLISIVIAALLMVNLLAMLYFIPYMRRHVLKS